MQKQTESEEPSHPTRKNKYIDSKIDVNFKNLPYFEALKNSSGNEIQHTSRSNISFAPNKLELYHNSSFGSIND